MQNNFKVISWNTSNIRKTPAHGKELISFVYPLHVQMAQKACSQGQVLELSNYSQNCFFTVALLPDPEPPTGLAEMASKMH